jgi:hypothetical protein
VVRIHDDIEPPARRLPLFKLNTLIGGNNNLIPWRVHRMKISQFPKRPFDCWRPTVIALVIILAASAPVVRAGNAPLLEFDVPFAVSCRSIASADAAKKHPGQDLIEVEIPITARLLSQAEKDIKQCVYALVDPTEPGTLTVLDWLPRTELQTEFAKPIQFNNEHTAKIGINMSARYFVTAAGDAMGQLKSGVAYELLPPRETVLASGTIRSGHGVYFKLKPSTQTTLEGMKLFSAICAVPRGWRGGCLELRCQAIGLDRGMVPLLDRQVESSVAIFCLALYLEGDSEAEKLADRVANCQQELFDSLAESTRQGKAKCFRSWGLNRFFRVGGDPIATTEQQLLEHVLNRTTATMLTEEFPPAVLARFRQLQGAVEALQLLSADKNGDGKPARSRTTVTVGFAPLGDSDKEKRSEPQPPLGHYPSLAKAEIKDIASATIAADSKQTSKRAVRSNGQPLSPEVAANNQIGGTGHNGGQDKVTPPSATNPLPTDLPPRAITGPIWYIIASVGGAVVTSLLITLVVGFWRKHRRNRRLIRSKGVQIQLPATKYGAQILVVSKPIATPKQAQLLDIDLCNLQQT